MQTKSAISCPKGNWRLNLRCRFATMIATPLTLTLSHLASACASAGGEGKWWALFRGRRGEKVLASSQLSRGEMVGLSFSRRRGKIVVLSFSGRRGEEQTSSASQEGKNKHPVLRGRGNNKHLAWSGVCIYVFNYCIV